MSTREYFDIETRWRANIVKQENFIKAWSCLMLKRNGNQAEQFFFSKDWLK